MVHLRIRLVLTALLLVAAPVRAWQGPADTDSIVVIVHPAVPLSSLPLSEARRIYLRRSVFWSDQARIHPVNLPATSPVRVAFSRRVLGRAPAAMAAYWNDLYFHGTAPPQILESEAAVLLFVARTPGAIGYVRRSVLTGADLQDVRTVLVIPP